ncbi:MAG: phosphotransferase [Pseudomonadota bacterium]
MTADKAAPKDGRRAALQRWLAQCYPHASTLRPVAADAGSRRYFRFDTDNGTRVAVDSPPEREDNATFLSISAELAAAQVRVPAQFEADLVQGFLVMEDFGDTLFAAHTGGPDASAWYARAVDLLVSLHRLNPATRVRYDRTLIARELDQFPRHYLAAFNHRLTPAEARQWADLCAWLADAFEDGPAVWTHRDFHCRNLLVLEDQTLGVIDYQGALSAPPGYDLASLLRDCYVGLPETVFEHALAHYADTQGTDLERLRLGVDRLGLQRHLKCLGAFVRFARELDKPQFLPALPLTERYVRDVAARYPAAHWLGELLDRHPASALA